MKTIEEIDLKEVIESETLETFKKGKIHSPFNPNDKTPSFTIYFDSNYNKWKFKDFSSGECGDALDFIMKYKNMTYKEARSYLDMEVTETESEKLQDKLKKYVEGQLKTFKKGYELIGIFPFVDEFNQPLYYKVKFKRPNGTKETPYYHFEDGRIHNSRGTTEEYIYNLYNVLEAVKNDNVIVIVEGEKDVNTVNRLLRSRKYVATSLKNVKSEKQLGYLKGAKIYVIGDTGIAGDKYVEYLKNKLFKDAEMFKIIKLPGLKAMGDNKDVTDWIEEGHTREELLNAFRKSLDLKDINTLQQDYKGIYRTIVKNTEDEQSTRKVYLTDFQILEASKVNLADEDKEGIRLKLKSYSGNIYEKIGNSNVFNDIRSFRNFLATIDLNFLEDKTKSVVELGKWINDYWMIENEVILNGVAFRKLDDELYLTTQEGSLKANKVEYNIMSDKSNNINVIDKESITKEELEELMKHLFRFILPTKSISIIGTVINNMCVYQAKENKIKLHHLLIVGESGSGKSTILANVIAPLLNYPIKDIKSIGLITPFALTKDLSNGNYTSIFDEFKPSSLDRNKIQKISETLRNLYDRASVIRGDKSFKVREFRFERPIIMAGEESYPHNEKALIERSCIVYISKEERAEEFSNNMKWLIENEDKLNKLGRTLIEYVLNLSVEDYKSIRNQFNDKFIGLKNRPLTTALNVATGIQILNNVLVQYGLEKYALKDYERLIESNIKEEILDNGTDTKSTVEQMLCLFDDMIADDRIRGLDTSLCNAKMGTINIKTSEMINKICEFCNKVGSAELIPLKLKDFKKQAIKSKYILKENKAIRINFYGGSSRVIRFDVYNEEKLRKLGCLSLIEACTGLEEIKEDKVIQGKF